MLQVAVYKKAAIEKLPGLKFYSGEVEGGKHEVRSWGYVGLLTCRISA